MSSTHKQNYPLSHPLEFVWLKIIFLFFFFFGFRPWHLSVYDIRQSSVCVSVNIELRQSKIIFAGSKSSASYGSQRKRRGRRQSYTRNLTIFSTRHNRLNTNGMDFFFGQLQCIYGRARQTILLDRISCPVLHHNTNPTWYEEIKIRLPLNISTQHHILFSFIHVSCDLSKRRDTSMTFETPVGYSWMPLLSKGKINVEEQLLPVAATLPPKYLSIQPLGLGKGVRLQFRIVQ